MVGWLISLVERRRGLAWAAVGVISVGALAGLPRLVFDDDPVALFRSDDEAWTVLEQLKEDFETGSDDLLVVLQGEQLFRPEVVAGLREFRSRASAIDGVVGVTSVLELRTTGWPPKPLFPEGEMSVEQVAAAREQVLGHPLAGELLVSKDGKTMLVLVQLDRGQAASAKDAAVPLGKVRDAAAEVFGAAGVDATVTGEVAVRVDSLLGVMHDFTRLLILSAVIAAALALFAVRHPVAALVVVIGPAIGVLWTVGALGWAGVPIDAIGSVLPMLVFIVGFANAVHLMIDFRRCRGRGEPEVPAAADTVRHLAFACSLTALTTALGFGSLMLAETDGVQRFGAASAVGTLVSLAAVLVVVPLLCAGPLGMRIPGSKAPGHHRRSSRWLGRLSLPSRRHPWIVTGLAVAGSVGLLWLALDLKSDLVITEALPKGSETARALEVCDEAFGGSIAAHVVVRWEEEGSFESGGFVPVLEELHRLLEARDLRPVSALNYREAQGVMGRRMLPLPKLLKMLPPSARARVLGAGGQQMLVTVRLPNQGARALRPVLEEMEKELEQVESLHEGYTLTLTGAAVMTARNIRNTIRDLLRSLSFASVFVFGIITVSLRSLRMGLICILPNAFPLLFNAGLLSATGQPLQIASVITFSVCLGIAVDNTIHFLMRFRREMRAGLGRRDAVTAVFESTGRAMIISTVVILGGVLPALFSELPSLHLFGGLFCTALLAALVGDLFILPALLVLFWPKPKERGRPLPQGESDCK